MSLGLRLTATAIAVRRRATVEISLAETLVNAFIARVEADGGTVESKACLLADVEALDPQE